MLKKWHACNGGDVNFLSNIAKNEKVQQLARHITRPAPIGPKKCFFEFILESLNIIKQEEKSYALWTCLDKFSNKMPISCSNSGKSILLI